MAYTTINKSTAHFNTKLYTGNGSNGHSISGVGFQPDLVWIKARSAGSTEHHLMDVLQGWGTGSSDTPNISSNNTSAAYNRNIFSSNNVNADGFELNDYSDTNTNGQTHVAWNWKAGGAGSANSDGDANSTVSVNTTSGFSMVKFNTNGQSGTFTVGHGLGAVPKMMILKPLPTTDAWWTYHTKMGNGKYLKLNTTDAEASNANIWGSTTPTSSVFSMNTGFWGANTNDIIAYCFAEKVGYSKFGKYTGNGSTDGTFVYTGFKPTFILTKDTSATSEWHIYDNKRDTNNPNSAVLCPNGTYAESTNSNGDTDFLSNGFKLRNSNSNRNGSGNTYIYMAFGQSIVGTNNTPCTAF